MTSPRSAIRAGAADAQDRGGTVVALHRDLNRRLERNGEALVHRALSGRGRYSPARLKALGDLLSRTHGHPCAKDENALIGLRYVARVLFNNDIYWAVRWARAWLGATDATTAQVEAAYKKQRNSHRPAVRRRCTVR